MSNVMDTAETIPAVSMTPWKSIYCNTAELRKDFMSPYRYLLLKGKSNKNVSTIIYKYFNHKPVGG
jgi:hypothetical protein